MLLSEKHITLDLIIFVFFKMIFEQLFFDKFCDNFISHIHNVFLLSLFITLIFVLLPKFICIIWLSNKLPHEKVLRISFALFSLFTCVEMTSLHCHVSFTFHICSLFYFLKTLSQFRPIQK